MKLKNSIALLFFLCTLFVQAQDTLLELGSNMKLRAYYNEHTAELKKNKPQQKALLTLPFFEDFSQQYPYPDYSRWQDINVHINSNFADDPISYGVATFDGLDSTGYPYNFSNPTAWGPADTLTSHPIDLTSPVDSVFFSFYYQPQGMGNKPETKDSIRLEFFRKSDSTWVRMWGTPGTPNHPFKRVMIPVDTSFQNNEFQFRFMNWATLSGNVDHWNVDYIFLDENRSYDDTVLVDVTFVTDFHNMLAEFTAMPWRHYVTDSLNFMAKSMDVTYKNNDTVNHAVYYKYRVIENNGAGPVIETYPLTTSNQNVPPDTFKTIAQAVYDVTPTFVNDFYFPPDASANRVFQIKNYFDLNSFTDEHPENDTVNSYQAFGSYYAYDDGSAEVGYGVQGIGSKLAHQFNIKKSDTLTAFQIYFTPISNNLSGETFRLKVWSSLNPEVEVYSQSATQFTSPIYSNTDEFLNYYLDAPVYLTAGTYYFGWEKISSEFLNVGWDLNTNNKTKVHFNSVGIWQTASFDGTLMLRPVFGSIADPQVGVDELVPGEDDIRVYPNPASTQLQFTLPADHHYQIDLLNLNGQIVTTSGSSQSTRMDVSSIANGVYIVRFTDTDSQQSVFKKVVISR
ncbi:MAG: T9SS type A sorting domain-containing protein [Flavobacteriales bacterium]|nr:T9SS type A sorting domain-containing protein [Flavobacteriales bacterium]